jgi:cysteine desulfurase
MGSPLQSEPTLSVPREIGRGTILDRWRLPDGTLYLDNAATRPMLPEVAEEMARLMADNPLNASSQHKYGQKAARMLEDARNFFKSELNVPSTGELIFNSGATEGLNMLLKSAYFADPTNNHIVTVKTEHKAVLNTCAYLETIGAEVTYLDVDEWGQISVSDIEAAIRPTTCAVAVMAINNETGLVANVGAISEVCLSRDTKYICDATQAVGKRQLDLSLQGMSAVVAGAHKIGGAVGSGLVAVQDSSCWAAVAPNYGGFNRTGSSGTQAVASICSFVHAYRLFQCPTQNDVRLALRELDNFVRFRDFYPRHIERSHLIVPVLFPPEHDHIDLSEEFVFSRGSACSSGVDRLSEVYQLLPVDATRVRRFSF